MIILIWSNEHSVCQMVIFLLLSFFLHSSNGLLLQATAVPFFFLISVFKLFICMSMDSWVFILYALQSITIIIYSISQIVPGLLWHFRWFNSQISALLKINPLQEMPVWRCGIGEKMKMYRWRRKNAQGMKDKGYWNQILAAPRMKDKRLIWIQKLRVPNTPDFYTLAGDLTIWQLARRFKKIFICLYHLNIQRSARSHNYKFNNSISQVYACLCACVCLCTLECEQRAGCIVQGEIKISAD